MPSEQYVENILMRRDGGPEVNTPTFADTDVDSVYSFKGNVRLVQILKSVQNAVHNQHDYVFIIESIEKIKKDN